MGREQNQHISMDLHVALLDKIPHQDDEKYGENFQAFHGVQPLCRTHTCLAKRACCKISSDSDVNRF